MFRYRYLFMTLHNLYTSEKVMNRFLMLLRWSIHSDQYMSGSSLKGF